MDAEEIFIKTPSASRRQGRKRVTVGDVSVSQGSKKSVSLSATAKQLIHIRKQSNPPKRRRWMQDLLEKCFDVHIENKVVSK